MNETIKVHVVKYCDRDNLVMRYRDPLTGRHVTRSTRTPKLREAERRAAVWESELREQRYSKPSRMSWEDFRTHYSTNALPALAASSVVTYESTLNVFERLCRPQRLADVTTGRVTAFATELRKLHRSEATIARHLRHLKAAMRWANRQGLLSVLPAFTTPKRVKGAKVMRGRPIVLEEFERLLSAVPKVVDNAAVPSYQFYLRGLWDSGLRLSESLTLRWDDAPGAIVVDLSGRRPMLRIAAEAQKAHRDQLLPITPEFATLLQSVPEARRRGRVFRLQNVDRGSFSTTCTIVGRTVSAIGKAAGVIVDERQRGKETKRKFASAHDLRRAFGQRWAAKVMPNVLRELMRHASIQTTMAYYVGQNAEAAADAIWGASGTILGNSAVATESATTGNALKQGV